MTGIPARGVPDLALVSDTGSTLHLADFRGRKNLVLVLMTAWSPAARELLRDLQNAAAEFATEEAVVLPIIKGSVSDARDIIHGEHLAFPVYADEGGLAFAAVDGDGSAAIVVADRYGEIFFSQRVPAGAMFPAADALLDWIRFIELQCPE